MALSTIYPNGVIEIEIPATQSIAVSNYGGGIASIYYLVENANRPAAYKLQQTLENAGVVLGAFAAGQKVKIEAGSSTVIFDVGSSPDTGIGDADTLNGMASDTGDTADTIAARDGSGDITANAFESTVATGTAPLTVASTTVVANLNAEKVGGVQASNLAKLNVVNEFTASQTINTTSDSKIQLRGTPDPYIAYYENNTLKGYLRWYQDGYMWLRNLEDSSALRLKDDLDFSSDGTNFFSIYHEGNDSNLAKLNGTQTLTGTNSFASGGVEIVASSGAKIYSGAGSPESAVTASPGSLYLNTSGGANTTLYVKESGTGNTGWIAK